MSTPSELRDALPTATSTLRRKPFSLERMAAILEIPEVRRRVSHLTIEEYHRLDEFNENGRRTELIRGIVIEKISKSPQHSKLGKRLYDLLLRLIPTGFIVWREDPLTLADSEPEPDVAVVKGAPEDFDDSHPRTAELVIEVAVSSAALDREMAALYADAGVTEYWIVLAPERQVEVYRRPLNGRYSDKRLYRADETIECVGLPGVRVRVSEIFP
jgi:Uma2 family endonuclease